MSTPRINTLPVPGATLYYTMRGAGPVLLLIAGAAGDAESFNLIADSLAEHYTVVTYDRRGLARSPLDDPDQPIEIETHSADAHRLLAALGTAPAAVLGSSFGAVVGLDLAIRHPEQLRVLVAHEPVLVQLFSEAERPAVDLEGLASREGAAAVFKKFATSVGVNHDRREPGAALPQGDAASLERRLAFLTRDRAAIERCQLDLAALHATQTRVVIAGGEDGQSFFPYQSAARLATYLGTAVVAFPGDHAGFVNHPQGFAARLHQILGA